ncbi:hypothetical protein [Candidatus Nanohalobium constans]|uniref:Uncharacterized protein n=1 Tax=Candidatus Nanohalobium constans TaxID=2565781 RepID=A0A5Q0UIC3_9ARCH|nr:hypothetical protein [Candidatus Nanohalobium constans]QGA80629.1 hypothetical protein LC1Nh_0743 [Candidatus Nanohalobium constans]
MAEQEDDETVREEDIFGLPKLSTNAEVAISFTLFVLGNLLLFTVFYASGRLEAVPLLGLTLNAVAYLFMMEAVREFEEKDHFLSRKLMKD